MKTHIALLTFGLIVFVLCTAALSPAFDAEAHGGRNHECEDGLDVSTGDGNHMYYEAPSGQHISGVCIKAGNTPFGDGHSDVFTSDDTFECYTVEGIGTSRVDVTRQNDNSSCQELSHIDIYTQNASVTPTPGDSESPTPSETQNSTPTPTDADTTSSITPTQTPACENGFYDENGIYICIDCPGGGECEVVIGDPTPTITPTPTQTPTATATHTPTPTESQNNSADDGEKEDSSDNGSSDSENAVGGSEYQSSGEVLGASTLADTGFDTVLASQVLLLFGFVCVGSSTASCMFRRN